MAYSSGAIFLDFNGDVSTTDHIKILYSTVNDIMSFNGSGYLNEPLVYNQLVSSGLTGFIRTSGLNLGGGQELYKPSGIDLTFKTLVSGNGINIVSDENTVTISSFGPAGAGESNTGSNLGNGSGLFAQKIGVDLQFKSIIPGSGITINGTSNSLEIGSRVFTKALLADQNSNNSTPAIVTGLRHIVNNGTYTFQYFIRYRSDTAGTGSKFDVNHTGTVTSFVWNQRWVDVSATASTSVPDQDNIQTAGGVMGAFASRSKGTAGRGTSLSVDTVNLDMLTIIEGLMVVTVPGSLDLYYGSEASAAGIQTIKQDSAFILTKIA